MTQLQLLKIDRVFVCSCYPKTSREKWPPNGVIPRTSTFLRELRSTGEGSFWETDRQTRQDKTDRSFVSPSLCLPESGLRLHASAPGRLHRVRWCIVSRSLPLLHHDWHSYRGVFSYHVYMYFIDSGRGWFGSSTDDSRKNNCNVC